MPRTEPGQLLRIHVSESDRWEGQPLFHAVIAKCRELKIAGATVLRGLEGYGETAELHRAHLVRHDQPIVITVVDTAANLALLIPAVEGMVDTGVLAVSDVEMIRVQKTAPAS